MENSIKFQFEEVQDHCRCCDQEIKAPKKYQRESEITAHSLLDWGDWTDYLEYREDVTDIARDLVYESAHLAIYSGGTVNIDEKVIEKVVNFIYKLNKNKTT